MSSFYQTFRRMTLWDMMVSYDLDGSLSEAGSDKDYWEKAEARIGEAL